MNKLLKYVLIDILQNRILLGYTLFLLAASLGLFALTNDPSKGVISLLNILLLVLPLVSLVFATIQVYNSYEFIELLAAQPLPRKMILGSQYWGLSIALTASNLIGIGLPVLLFSPTQTGLTLVGVACALSIVFTSIALWIAVRFRDKSRGIGAALLVWFWFSLMYDAIVLMLMFSFSDYPIEKAMLGLLALNPIDLARITVMLQTDVSALLGYTGALFREFLHAASGAVFLIAVATFWIFFPLWRAGRVFSKKDF